MENAVVVEEDKDIKRQSTSHNDDKKHRRSSVSNSKSSSRSRNSSKERRRRRKRRKEKKHRRRSSSSDSSRGRHRSRKYRRHRKHRRHSSSSSNSSSSRSSRGGESRSKIIADKKSHPYFSRISKLRRERLNKEKKERFWDGFQWVSKESLELASKDPTKDLKHKDPSQTIAEQDQKIVTGKDLRRIVATNLPLDYGIDHEDLGYYIITKCKENGDDVLFKSIFLNTEHNSGILECSEKEMTDLVAKLDGVQLLGNTLRFTKVADEKGFIHGGDSENLLQESAQLTAQAAAIVNARIRNLQGKESSGNLNLLGDSFSSTKPSRIVKISNVFDRYSEMNFQQFQELYDDMEEEMLRFGQPKRIQVIRNGDQKIGSEVGSVFVEFETDKEGIDAKEGLKGRIYDGREIKVIFIDEKLFKTELKLKDD